MYVSFFELFKIGIGPSSSHTVGPLNASLDFRQKLIYKDLVFDSIHVTLYGSLAYTGIGHKTPQSIYIGLSGRKASEVGNNEIQGIHLNNPTRHTININNIEFKFSLTDSIKYNKKASYAQTNPMKFQAFRNKKKVYEETYFSIGGGFIKSENDTISRKTSNRLVPHNFKSMKELIEICHQSKANIYEVVLENEQKLDPEKDIKKNILNIWHTMNEVIKNGIEQTGRLDDILKVERRANYLYKKIIKKDTYDPLDIMDWVNIYAIASCEENAAGNRIVTAPTNGAAGIIPAVLKYYDKFIKGSTDKGIIDFLLTSSSIGMLFKNNASISGAEMGCQGEVGVACSMAAAGLTAAMGGSAKQIENAAEIAMEHNLGLTCDPIKGLVQIPCIERNSMGAIKAINSSRLALNSDKPQKVSLDDVIKTMNETGKAMNSKYKETALGGLAVNVVEC